MPALLRPRGLSLELRPWVVTVTVRPRITRRVLRVRCRCRRGRPGLALPLFQAIRHLSAFPVFALVARLPRRARPRLLLVAPVLRLPILQLLVLVLVGLRLRLGGRLALDDAREVVRDAQVERRRLELDLAAHDLRPLVPRGVDPADEVEVVHALERAQVRALWETTNW